MRYKIKVFQSVILGFVMVASFGAGIFSLVMMIWKPVGIVGSQRVMLGESNYEAWYILSLGGFIIGLGLLILLKKMWRF